MKTYVIVGNFSLYTTFFRTPENKYFQPIT